MIARPGRRPGPGPRGDRRQGADGWGCSAPARSRAVERLNDLIFHPGFSTKEEASTISGRGVGMDVVAREVGLLKGTIDLADRARARDAADGAAAREAGAGDDHDRPGRRPGLRDPHGPDRVRLALSRSNRKSGSARGGDRESPFRQGPGQELPLSSAAKSWGSGESAPATWPKLLVVRTDGSLVGLVVDAIEGIQVISPEVKSISISSPGMIVFSLALISLANCSRSRFTSSGTSTHRGCHVLRK